MTARKAIFGLCAACAILFSAVVAQSAMAEGQTAVTCKPKSPTGGVGFSDAHCKTKVESGATFEHATWTEGEDTTGELTNETTGTGREPGLLKATIAGLETIIEAKNVFAQGVIVNGKTAGGEMFATGTTENSKGEVDKGGILFTEVTVTNRTCTFTGVNPDGTETVGSVETQPIHASTEGLPFGNVLFKPITGTKFAEFKLSGASCPAALVGEYPVFGAALAGPIEGATLSVVHNTVTTQKETATPTPAKEGEKIPALRLKNAATGPLAGLAGKVTIRAGKTGTTTPEWNPISLTKG